MIMLLCALQGGCALIMNGFSQDILISSNPDGAAVIVNGEEIGVTPMMFTVARNNAYTVTLRKPGYHPTSCQLAQEVSPWFWGSLFSLTGPLEFLSYIKGSLYDITPASLYVELQQIGEGDWEPVELPGEIVPGVGWQGLSLGSSAAEVEQLLGAPDKKSQFGHHQFVHYYGLGLFIYLIDKPFA